MITKQLAEQIVDQTMVRLHRNINVMDINGMILASGDHERIERIHEGAAYVAKTGVPLFISEQNLGDWFGSKPGINMPISFQGELIGVIGITGDPQEIKEFATLVQLTTEMIVHQAMISSEAEWKRKMHELIFAELISNKSNQPTSKDRMARTNYIQNGPYSVVLLEFTGKHSSHLWLNQLEDLFKNDFVLIGHERMNEMFILTSLLEMGQLVKKLTTFFYNQSGIRIGFGKEVMELSDIRLAYDSAKIALKHGKPDQMIIHYEDVELISLLKRINPKDAAQFSGRILKEIDPKLRQTLSVYLSSNQRHAECAEKLEIHRHTLAYRLDKIKELSGYDPTCFSDALKLQLALLLAEEE